ncbi:MAG TPA: MMPL family transporter [Nitrososphaerales archaeon]|nr:MMPL family transporter [Nitrososphaerales archaeon]
MSVTTLSKSLYDDFYGFIRRSYRWIIVGWIILALLSLTLVPSFFSSVSFNITSGNFGNTNGEAQRAQNIISAQFPSIRNGSDNSIIIVLQNASIHSNAVKSAIFNLNSTIASDSRITNYTGMTSIYNIENSILNSTFPRLLNQTAELEANITTINKGLHSLKGNFSTLSSSMFQLENGINQTAQLVYGVPSAFVDIYSHIVSSGVTDPYIANSQANMTLYSQTGGFGGNPETIGYYTLFYRVWNSTFQTLPNSTSLQDREAMAINQTATQFLQNPQLDSQTKKIFTAVATGLNVTTWNQQSSISNLTISTLAPSIPAQLTSTLGVTSQDLLTQLHSFGPSPSESTLSNYTISLFESSLSKNGSANVGGFSTSELLHASYNLGSTPTDEAKWNLSASFVANATANVFSGSPLFTVNETSLETLISHVGPNATSSVINKAINDLVVNESLSSFPFVPERSVTRNLVSQNNDSMIILLNFSSQPDAQTISSVSSHVLSSELPKYGTVYVTGSPVITQDVQRTFTPALGITVGPGIAISLLIVGLLFLSPIAAIIPIILGGIAIAIAYPAIYLGIVVVGHGTITFLTPTLATLLMLGLAVDYAVLQLRRTREERLNGRTKEQSVGVSVRWAGQAVLTAGITVIVAYIVMAVANVPLFADVGAAIALGVSILLVGSLTLLPSLELALGDRLFWPMMKRQQQERAESARRAPFKESRLRKIAEGTLRRKLVIAMVISLVALGAFYYTYTTPVGADFLKLVPNFPSNQGLTAITNSLGSGTIAPTQIVVTTPTPITYGRNQFNQTLLDQIELISREAAGSSGIVSVIGPTRPFGSPFNYSSVGNLSEPVKSQYEGAMLSQIGKDNKTAVINVGLSSDAEGQAAINSMLGMEQNVNKLSLANGVQVVYGGATQSTYDSQSFLTGLIPQVIIILAAAVYVILLLQLRSALTPLRLIFTILCSVVFSLALLSVIFYYALNLPILDFAPLFVVVTMLGVGIDYDIFFVTRIREEVLNGKSDNDAIKTAVDKVWVTILGLGLVLSTVFGSLLITGIAILQEISLAVSGAILIDVLVVILFFVPSLMGLAQRFNWWPSKIGGSRNGEGEDNKKSP